MAAPRDATPAPAQAMFHGDAAHTGLFASQGPRTAPALKWSFATKGPVLASPALSGGVVYIGSDDGSLYALDARTGALRWQYDTEGPVGSSPAVAGGLVYVASRDGNVYAIAADTGKLRWKFATAGERRFEAKGIHGIRPATQTMPDPWDLLESSPAISGGVVYICSGDGNLYALDAGTGALRCKFATHDVIHASPAIAAGTVYVGSWDSYLYAIDAETGRQRWRFKTGEDPDKHNQVGFQSSPAVVGDTVYVGCRDAHVYAVNAATGERRWAVSTKGSWVIATPAVHDGLVYVGTSDTDQFLALDARTGAQRFAVKTGGYVFSSAAFAAGFAYVGAFDGRLYAIDTTAGRVAWTYATKGAVANAHAVLKADGSLDEQAVFGGAAYFEDYVRAVATLLTAGAVVSSPAIADGVVYFGSADGNVYALQ